jgi:hypothetical protein
MGFLEQWISLGVKQRRGEKYFGAYTRISGVMWPYLTELDKRTILKLLMSKAHMLSEMVQPMETRIRCTGHYNDKGDRTGYDWHVEEDEGTKGEAS